MFTTILNDDLDIQEEDEQLCELDDDIVGLKTKILDFTIPENHRLIYFDEYYNHLQDEALELVRQLCGMYQFSGTRLLQSFLLKLIYKTKLTSILKFEAVLSLLCFVEDEEDINEKQDDIEFQTIKLESNIEVRKRNEERNFKAYDALNYVCEQMHKDNKIITTTTKIEIIIELMKNKKYKTIALNHYQNHILKNYQLSSDFVYKSILSLERRLSTDTELIKFYMSQLCMSFFVDNKQQIMYRILASQYLFQCDEYDNDFIEHELLKIAKDVNNDINLRADASDTVLNLGTNDKNIKEARDIILELGNYFGKARTIFENAQNVHAKEIEKSVKEILDVITKTNTIKNPNDKEIEIDLEFVYLDIDRIILEYYRTDEQIKKIKLSLNRIRMDRTLYNNMNLSGVLIKLWSYISQNEYKIGMEQRLLEELEEMSGTCSSGFITRLVNVVSGFGELSIRISIEDQIVSNFVGRITSYQQKIMESTSPFFNEKWNDVLELYLNLYKLYTDMQSIDGIENSDKINVPTFEQRKNAFFKSKQELSEQSIKEEIVGEFSDNILLNEMMLKSSEHARRQCFALFLRTYLSKIREELYEKFKGDLTDTEFDLAFRRAISVYEGN